NQPEQQFGIWHSVADRIEHLERFDGAFEDPVTTLPIRVRSRKVRQRSDHFNLVFFEKLRKIFIARHGQDREIAAVHDVPSQAASLWSEPAEVWIHFWGAAGDIDHRYGILAQDGQALLHGLLRHDLRAIGTGIHVAVLAGLVAHLSDVDL